MTPHFRSRGLGIRDIIWMRGEGPGSAINMLGLYVPVGLGPHGHVDWISTERHLDCLVEGAKGNWGCRDLATAGWLEFRWHGRQKRRGAQGRKPLHNGYWESLAPENGHGEPGSLNPSYRVGSRQAPGVGMGRSQRSGVGLARCPYTVPSYP